MNKLNPVEELKFTACKFLDFTDTYSAKKELINNLGVTKLVWHRKVLDTTYPSLVQFCKRIGRLNNAEACLCKLTAQCNDYEEQEHIVSFNTINLS